MSKLDTRVIQVTNVAPTTTKDQLKTLFQFIGRIRDCKLFPPEGSDQQVAAKVCYVEFEDPMAAGVALHLTNTVFIDRALIVVPVIDGRIPDEKVAMQLTPQTVARMAPGQPSWPTNVVSQLTGTGVDQVISTYDPRMNALGLPQYPPLPAGLDAAKVEEVRRTVYIGNLDPKTTPESLISFFTQAGEVKYVRMAGENTSIARAAYLELTDQRSVTNYLGYNGVTFNGRIITVSHAKSSINKPLTKSQEASRREVEDAMKKVQEAQSLISAAASSEKYNTRSRSRSRRRSRSRGGSRSRSRSRRRSRSRSRGRRRRSRSRSKRRSRSPRRVRRSRSRSPRRRRSRSRSGFVVIPARERRRSRSKSRSRRRSRSRSNRRRSRTPPKAYAAAAAASSRRSRSRGPRRKSRSRSPRRSSSRSRGKGKDRKEKAKDSEKKKKEAKVSRSRSPSPPTLQREGSAAPPHSGDDGSPARLDPSTKEETAKQSETVTVSEPAPSSESKKTRSDPASSKKSSQKRDRSKSGSRSPVRGSRRRSGSRSPAKASRRRSVSPPPRKRRSKSRSPRRSRSPAKKKKARSPRRSRSGSRHRSKKDKKKERSRSRERKEKKEKKKNKEKKGEEKMSSSSSKVARNYDEEEKGFNSASDREEGGGGGHRPMITTVVITTPEPAEGWIGNLWIWTPAIEGGRQCGRLKASFSTICNIADSKPTACGMLFGLFPQ